MHLPAGREPARLVQRKKRSHIIMQKTHYNHLDEVNLTNQQSMTHTVAATEPPLKRHFVKVDETAFVNEIKKRPILYNMMHKDYKRISLRNDSWVDVALAINLSVQECKKRWRSMRDAFLKNLRTKGEEQRKTWIHYRLLEFLLPFAQLGKRQSNDSHDPNLYNENDFDYFDIDSDLDLYDSGPITVSYMTEDGKELFQILHSGSADLSDAEVEAIEDEEVEELEEIEAMPPSTSLLRSQDEQIDDLQHQQSHDVDYLVSSEAEEGSEYESVVYEERLDSTMLDFCKEIEGSEMDSIWKATAEESEVPKISYRAESKTLEPMEEQIPDPVRNACSTEPRLSESKLSSTLVPAITPSETTPTPVASAPQSEEELRNQVNKESDARLGITDPDERFLMSCAPILRRLPNKKNLLARLRIQQMLFELEYDEKYSGT